MIDLHSHILPGLDDGARDLSESLDMLRLAAADGTKVICATPHRHGPSYDVPAAAAEAAWKALVEAAAQERIAIEVRLAAEAWFRVDLPELVRDGKVTPFSAGPRRYLLLEFPPTHVPTEAADTLFRLRLEGVTPVIAHPERNPSFWARPGDAVALRDQGALLQVTAGSLTGLFRKESMECARELARRGAVDLIASDAHRRDRRLPGIAEASRVLAKWAGKRTAERSIEGVPHAILAGAPVPDAA